MAEVLIQHKQSNQSGKIPQLVDLEMGELSVNTYDGKIFFKRDDGTETIESVVTTNTQVTGSIDLVGTVTDNKTIINDIDPTTSMFEVNRNNSERFKINSEGTTVIGKSDPLPAGEEGALAVSGSNFFIFL